jgi:hypothetical protein
VRVRAALFEMRMVRPITAQNFHNLKLEQSNVPCSRLSSILL